MFDQIATGRYWDKPWSLVSGCTRCSPGCDRCWALAMERRFAPRNVKRYEGICFHYERLAIPLKRKKPTVWAVWNDLFHEDVPYAFAVKVFETICSCRGRHTFLILTKRPKRLAEFIKLAQEYSPGWFSPSGQLDLWNTWLGVTVCNQAEAEEKIPVLLQIPAAVRWVSLEPMLGPVNLDPAICYICGHTDYIVGSDGATPFCREHGEEMSFGNWLDPLNGKISWVVLGGETGPGGRPMHPDWVRSVRDQCQEAGVPFYFKGWGAWSHELREYGPNGEPWSHKNEYFTRRAKNPSANRLLDGRTWDELPTQGVLI